MGIENTETATSYNNLGLLYQELKNYQKAEDYMIKSMKIQEKVFFILLNTSFTTNKKIIYLNKIN